MHATHQTNARTLARAWVVAALCLAGLSACGDDQAASSPEGNAPNADTDAAATPVTPDAMVGPTVDAEPTPPARPDYGALSVYDAALPPDFQAPPAPGSTATGTTGSVDTTFNHENEDLDVWDLLARLQDEGPPEYSAHVHSCPKMRYSTLGRVLASRGVDIGANGDTSAGRMYRTGDQALGVANYGARVPEASELTAASASKLFDLFVAAAPEIIARMPERAECTVGGVAAHVFNAQGQCDPSGLTCLMGVPAQPGHLEICNRILARASTPEIGRTLAVASILAAAHTCE